MKATKKIVGAACALVAAVALSAGSTFAWFSQSGTVKATGMNVKAATSRNILISNAEDGTFGISAQAKNTSTNELTPASTADGKAFFYVSNPEKVNYSDGDAKEGTTFVSTNTTVAGKTFVASYTYYVKADGVAGTEYTLLYVSAIDVKAGSSAVQRDITKALRVSVTYGSNAFIYAPVAGAQQTKGVSKAGTVSSTDDCTSSVSLITTCSNTSNLGKVTTTAAAVTINIWYEGEDAACTSANAVNVEEVSVEVSFSAGDTTPVQP